MHFWKSARTFSNFTWSLLSVIFFSFTFQLHKKFEKNIEQFINESNVLRNIIIPLGNQLQRKTYTFFHFSFTIKYFSPKFAVITFSFFHKTFPIHPFFEFVHFWGIISRIIDKYKALCSISLTWFAVLLRLR